MSRNSLNTLRLIFAALVVVSHSYPIGGFGDDPKWGDFTLGHFAVAAFFVASGFLVTKSRISPSVTLVSFAWARSLRIYPAFWVCLLLTAFAAAPLAALERGGWSLSAAVGYVLENFTLRLHEVTIGHTLVGAPYPNAWNGSLWTLFYEFACYLMIGLFLSVQRFRRGLWLAALFVTVTAGSLAHQLGMIPTDGGWFLLVPCFLGGSVLHHYRYRVPASPWLALAACVLLGLFTSVGWGEFAAPLPLAYLVMWLATVFPRVVERWRDGGTDISYGLYLYAFPIQQLMVVIAVNRLGVGAMIAASLACTVVVAALSWVLIEKPVLRYKHALLGRSPNPRRAAAPGVSR
ncbi:acyltransferase [Gordonia sp. zg691]|uniref:acyltransferase family protein n=1 Tax=Gordonia jinghuaiqii TaxID=2758710 RepID=UPI0016624DE5|nr:acyltransferase [Gordonia jinghuaiqii]MBD0864086.1 acyltransferase [Gordonia jinghuaiqii]